MDKKWVIFIGGGSDLSLATLDNLILKNDFLFFITVRGKGIAYHYLKDNYGDKIHLHICDLEYENDLKLLCSEIKIICGIPHVIIHFAAPKLIINSFNNYSSNNLLSNLNIQTFSFAYILKIFLPIMKKSKLNPINQIIFILSEVVKSAPPKGMTEYIVGKYAFLGLMRALKSEYSTPFLRIHGIAPKLFRSKFLGEVHPLIIEKLSNNGDITSIKQIAFKLTSLIYNPDCLENDDLLIN